MKKVLLATALAGASLSSANASAPVAPKYSPAGNGFYIIGQIGGGVIRISAEATAKIYRSGVEVKDGVLYFPFGGVQLNWGVSKRFANDMTLGFEAAFLSPGARLGYMIDETHHIALGAHYGLMGRLIVGSIVNLERKHLELSAMSFTGGSISYEHFTPSKNFFRVQLRADYYGLEGKGRPELSEYDSDALPDFKGKATIWDITTYIGFGSQW